MIRAMTYVKPPRLRRGDAVAVISPSWGGPAAYPDVFDAGLATLREELGLRVIEYPTARLPDAILSNDPRRRAADVVEAFANPEVRAVIASIGGDDSIRLLPHLASHGDVIRAHPKVLMGYSDTATLLVFVHLLGLVTFNGPAVMAGLAQASALPPEHLAHLRAMLFDAPSELEYRPFPWWSEGYPDWADPANARRVAAPRPATGFRWLQGSGVHTGTLFGGCLDVLELLKGTASWPTDAAFWRGRVLFLETSEEAPPVVFVRRALRNYGVQGAFDGLAALLIGRGRGYPEATRRELEAAIVDVVAREFGRANLPIIAELDFGHTDPQWIMPLGVSIEVDCDARRLRLVEPAVT